MDPDSAHSPPLAGPSGAPPVVFPPPAPLSYPPQYLHSTQNLLAVFNLMPAYDKYVRPHVRPIVDSKGKGKEREVPPADATADRLEADEQEGGGKKKKKDSYRHLIKRTPGKHSTKKDDYFQTLMGAPPKQKIHIQPIDTKTLREGFTVSLTGLPSYNKAALEGADPKEKELRRLKKERRKAEKERLRLQQEQMQGSASSASTPAAASTPRAGGAATAGPPVPLVRHVTSTPVLKGKTLVPARPGSARPSTPKPGTAAAAAVAAAPQRVASSTPVAIQPSGSAPRTVQNPGLVVVSAAAAAAGATTAGIRRPLAGAGAGTGAAAEAAANAVSAEKRGVKRELDSQQPQHLQQQQQQPSPGALPAATLVNGQRPLKKRRLGSSTPQPSPLQQPTPHGT